MEVPRVPSAELLPISGGGCNIGSQNSAFTEHSRGRRYGFVCMLQHTGKACASVQPACWRRHSERTCRGHSHTTAMCGIADCFTPDPPAHTIAGDLLIDQHDTTP